MSKIMNNYHIRYREQKRWFRKSLAVLQVGEEFKRGIYCGTDADMIAPPSWDENEIIIVWRDADMTDAFCIGKINEKKSKLTLNA